MRRITKHCILTLQVLALILPATALGKEGGDQYSNGAEGFLAGALPPPGHYFINYAGYYTGKAMNKDGEEISGVEVSAVFDALRYVRVTPIKLLGADWGFHVILPVVRQNIETPAGDNAVTGLGDITIDPLVLGWHQPAFHYTVGLDVNLPTGRYDKKKPLECIGANYVSVEPVFALTYLHASGVEGSVKLMYNLKTENSDTKYKSGSEFHADYLAGYHKKDWAYGVGGYLLSQLDDDKLDGTTVEDKKGQVIAVGPQVQYTIQGRSIILKWHHEVSATNRFGGDKVFLKFVTKI
jgi:hypothetical protein